ncbi:MAG: Cell division trigger factor [Cytophagales bacterium]|nr:trigger factor [Bacteroidota bacterium]MBS1982393.1 trigger factor [Bacteroidota bacterium]WHZ06674.1 MAG: Cell division trigger factor [Cytophagales bacterium]
MNITLDKKSATDGLIKIQLTESDYQKKVEEKVRDYSRKANINGFRQGKVPLGVIKKMFGKGILVDEVNHLISHSVSDYIRDNKLRVLGDPLPNEEKARTIDWDIQKDFEFEFQIGMVEDFAIDLSKKVKITSHQIDVDQKTIDETLEDIKRRFGKRSNPDVSKAGDNLFGEVSKKGSDEKQGSYIRISLVEKSQQKKFIGLKKDDTVEFDVEKTLTDASALSQLLNVDESEAKKATGTYVFKVTNVSRVEPAEINQELFDQVFGKDIVKSEEEFLNKIKETISGNYARETQHLLEHEIQHYYVDHTKINMPEGFLKTWLKTTSSGEVTDEVLEKEFNSYRDGLKWDLVKNKITEDHAIKVEEIEVREKAKQLIAEQFGGPAIAEQLGDKFDGLVMNYLAGKDGKGENYLRTYDQLRHEKIMNLIKENITITEKKVSLDEFKKLAESHRH